MLYNVQYYVLQQPKYLWRIGKLQIIINMSNNSLLELHGTSVVIQHSI